MHLLTSSSDKMDKIDRKYYVNVRELMNKELPRPTLKRTVFVTGWGEMLKLVMV